MSPDSDRRIDTGLPLALSVTLGERHYDADLVRLSGQIQILLDGRPIGRCCAYDVPKGTVTRHLRDSGGRILVSCGKAVTEVLQGEVEARWVQPAGAVSRD